MKVGEIAEFIGGNVVCGCHRMDEEVTYAFASDLMSDVLTTNEGNFVLITGLANLQLVRTAEMSDIQYLILARGKQVTEDMARLAGELDMVVICTPMSVFRVSGILYQAGILPVF